MTLNSSGPISLGGSTTGQSINLEIGANATATVSLNSSTVRTLAGVTANNSAITMPTDFYGKSYTVSNVIVRYLVVAGGGGAVGAVGGGGGGGGVVVGNITISNSGNTTISVAVGTGGLGLRRNDGYCLGGIGANSTLTYSSTSIVALGGGGGGRCRSGTAGGSGGGSGGSGGGTFYAGASATQPSSTSGGYGSAGGANPGGLTSPGYPSGGGGGANSVGGNAISTSTSGAGGNGISITIAGTTQSYGGGGGGGIVTGTAGAGGSGGGGAGTNYAICTPTNNGTVNTGGGGGGGGGAGGAGKGGTGGSGVVIIDYASATALFSTTGNVSTGNYVCGSTTRQWVKWTSGTGSANRI